MKNPDYLEYKTSETGNIYGMDEGLLKYLNGLALNNENDNEIMNNPELTQKNQDFDKMKDFSKKTKTQTFSKQSARTTVNKFPTEKTVKKKVNTNNFISFYLVLC